jgi:hypothetical protein
MAILEFVPAEEYTWNAPPPAGDVYGIYFPGAGVSEDVAKQVFEKLREIALHDVDMHILVSSRSDQGENTALRRFHVRQRPALVITKPWTGRDVGQAWDWESGHMRVKLNDRGKMPAHAIIQGPEAFQDPLLLAANVETLELLFGGSTHHQIEQELRLKTLAQYIRTVAGFLKNITLTFSVAGVKITFAYDEGGSVEVSEEGDAEQDDGTSDNEKT